MHRFAIDNQGMAVDHEHMIPVAQMGRIGIGLADQQGVGVCA